MKKRLLSALLALSVLCGSMPVYALESTESPATSTQSESVESSADSGTTEKTDAPQETPAEDAPSSAPEQQQNTYSGSVQVSLPDEDGPDNDTLFAEYMQQLMYGEYSIAPLANWGETTGVLNDYEKGIYEDLKAFAASAAAGQEDDAYEVPVSVQIKWSFSELGITGFQDADAVRTAVGKKFAEAVDFSKILSCLLVDCPADLYWFDKTFSQNGTQALACYYSISLDTQTYSDVILSNATCNMIVSQDYWKQGESSYTLDKAKIQSANKAIQNANDIVTDHQDDSDYEKMVAYRDAICEMTSYNTNAAAGNASYGNPWQMIYVFDDDKTNQVVCEGYAKAFQYLCDLSGITCYTVTGTMYGGKGEGPHMWNVVPIDGENYLVDVTNCDAGTIGAPDKLFLVGADGDVQDSYTVQVGSTSIRYTYDSETHSLYGNDPLTLASEDYQPGQPHQHSFDQNGFCSCGTYQPAAVQDGVYQIGNAGNLFWFAALVNGDKTHAEFDAQNTAADAVLTNNIDLANREWIPIGLQGDYTGHFDGQSWFIQNLSITAPDQDNGLFAVVGTDGLLENIYVEGQVQSTSLNAAGICASLKGGTIRQCVNRAGITNTQSGAGGICGTLFSGTVEDCINNGLIEGNTGAGGICAASYGTIRDCYSTGVVTGPAGNAGGILGRKLNTGTVENCYYADTAASVGIGSGETGADAKTREQLYSGEVTYLLNHSSSADDVIWRQFVGADQQAVPVLNTDVPIVYFYDNTYSNVPPLPAQDALTVAGLPADVVYGQTLSLTAQGGSGSGALQWSVTGAAQIQQDGTLQVTGVGPITVTVTKAGGDQYAPATASAAATAAAKTLTVAAATATCKTYDGSTAVQVTDVELDGVVAGDDVSVDLSKVQGTLPAAEVADYDRVKLSGLTLKGDKADCYTLAAVAEDVPVTVSVTAAEAVVETQPAGASDLTYTGESLVLVQPGTAVGGTLVYSLSADGSFTEELPSAIQAGSYTVWYKVKGDANHSDTQPQSLEVTVAKAAAPAIQPQTVQVRYTVTGAQTLSLAGLLPDDAGTLRYTAASKTDANGLVSDWSAADDGTVHYTLTGAGAAGNTATLTVTVGSDNYADATVQILLTMTDRDVPTGTVDPITYSYNGKPVPADKIHGTMSVPGSWSWKDKAPVAVADSGSYTVLFTPDDDKQYAPVEMTVQVTITKVLAVVTTEPQLVDNLTYTGKAQALATAGAADGGEMQYALHKEGPYQKALPTAVEAGSYEVWYIVLGDANHENLGAEQVGTVTIAKADSTPEIPAGLTAVYGDTLAQVALPQGWTWDDAAQSVGAVGSHTFAATYGGDANHNPLQQQLTVTVTPKDLTGAEITLSESRFVYNGQPQQPAVTAVTLEGTTLQQTDYTVSVDGDAVHAGEVTLTVSGTGNYSGTVSARYTIEKKPVTAVVTAQDKVYDGTDSAVVDISVETGVAGDTITVSGLTGTFPDKNAGENRTVRIHTDKVQMAGTQDYAVTIPETTTASIHPATFRYAVAEQQVRIGNGLDSVNAASSADGIVGETVNGTLTWYQDAAHSQPAGADYRFAGTAGSTVTLYWVFTPAADQTNYTQDALSGSTVFTLAEKAVPQLQAEGKTKVYDGQAVTLDDLTKRADVPGSWAFAKDTPELKNAGTYTVSLQFTPDDTVTYAAASIAVTVTIEKRPMVVQLKLSTNHITTAEAVPTAEVVYNGVVAGESLQSAVQPVITGLPEKAAEGVHPVRLANLDAMKQAIESLDAAKNYQIAYLDTVVLTVTAAEVLPGSDDQYRMEAESGVPSVPQSLVDAGLATEEEILDAMYEVASEKLPGTTREDTALYDVVLLVSEDNGVTWTEATPDNFPAEGLTVTLPYPEGTNAAGYDFAVTHMFTVESNGRKPGQVETPAVQETAEGIRFTVTSLSPITLSWKVSDQQTGGQSSTTTTPAATPAPSGSTPYYTCPACGYHNWTATDAGYRCDHCGYLESVKQLSGYGNVQGVYTPKSGSQAAAGGTTIAQTGDDSHPMLWMVLMLASAAGLMALAVYKRKRCSRH